MIKGLLDKGLVAPIVQLASKPTHFSLKWRLDDLEVSVRSGYNIVLNVQYTFYQSFCEIETHSIMYCSLGRLQKISCGLTPIFSPNFTRLCAM